MPQVLESGRIWLAPDEPGDYRQAAAHLQEFRERALDLRRPLTVDEWILLQLAHAAIAGAVDPLNDVIDAVTATIARRRSAQ